MQFVYVFFDITKAAISGDYITILTYYNRILTHYEIKMDH